MVNFGVASESDISRIIPTDKVNVFQDGKLIATLTQEAPLPTGVVLSCEGKCGIKLDDISLVAENKSLFSIERQGNTQIVNLQGGTVYFGMSKISGSVVFVTPKGAVSVNQVILDASTDRKMVEGYLKVDSNTSEIGVIEGGALTLLTRDDTKVLESGNRLILAQADIGAGNPKKVVKEEDDDDNRKGAWWLAGGGSVVSLAIGTAVTAGIIGSFASDLADDDDKDASPFEPTN